MVRRWADAEGHPSGLDNGPGPGHPAAFHRSCRRDADQGRSTWVRAAGHRRALRGPRADERLAAGRALEEMRAAIRDAWRVIVPLAGDPDGSLPRLLLPLTVVTGLV